MRISIRACIALFFVTCLACGSSNPSQKAAVATILISPSSPTIESGKTQQLTAVAKDKAGNDIASAAFAWKSDTIGVAVVDGTGLVTGVLAGTAAITASADGVSSTPVSVTVVAGAVASIAVDPPSATVASGSTQAFTAAAKDAAGNLVAGAAFTWRSDASDVAAVDASSGVALGSKAGEAHITAIAGNVRSAPATLTVGPGPLASILVNPASLDIAVGDADALLRATGLDAKENVISGLAFVWKSDHEATASVHSADEPGTAAVHAVAANGEASAAARITVAVGDVLGSVTVTVKPTPITGIAVAPFNVAIHAGNTQTLTAAAEREGVRVSGVTFAWRSSNTDVATVDATGKVTGLAAGTATITASARGITSKPGAALFVAKPIVIQVTPTAPSVVVASAQELTVSVSNAISDSAVTWSLQEANAGKLEAIGATGARYTAPCGKGIFHVVATANEDPKKSATATVTVGGPAAGALDPCFNGKGMLITAIGSSSAANALAVQADGKIVAAGKASDANGKMNFALARYAPDGALDTSFGKKGAVLTDFTTSSEARAVALQDDGKIVAVGVAGARFAIARYLADGSPDPTFNASVSPGRLTLAVPPSLDAGQLLKGLSSAAWDLVLQKPSGRIVVAGSSSGAICVKDIEAGLICDSFAGFALAGIRPDGTVDKEFGGGPSVLVNSNTDASTFGLTSLVAQPDGKLVGAGAAMTPFVTTAIAVARWSANGTIDKDFGTLGTTLLQLGDDASANSAAIQEDGKIVVVGRAHPVRSISGDSFALARFTTAGKLDTTFGSSGTVLGSRLGNKDHALNAVRLQKKDGAIVVVGTEREARTNLVRAVVLRYAPGGAVDESFGDKGATVVPFGDLDATGVGVAFMAPVGLSDGLIMLAGSYGTTVASSNTRFALARLWP